MRARKFVLSLFLHVRNHPPSFTPYTPTAGRKLVVFGVDTPTPVLTMDTKGNRGSCDNYQMGPIPLLPSRFAVCALKPQTVFFVP